MEQVATNGVCTELDANSEALLDEHEAEDIVGAGVAQNDQNELREKEADLQSRYQVDVIHSSDLPPLPIPKSFSATQKETAANLYNLCNDSHFLTLKLKHMKRVHSDLVRCLEKKWISEVTPESCEEDNVDAEDFQKELKFWSLQMNAYEENFRKFTDTYENYRSRPQFERQLCFDSSWRLEGFQEMLEFSTANRDYCFKVLIRHDGKTPSVESSIFLAGLDELVERCLDEKRPIDELIESIWVLFHKTIFFIIK